MLLNGIGCESSLEQSVGWYRKSAERGLAIALDYAEALKWFEKASLQGDTEASCGLGTMYRFGQGVPRNLLAAVELHLIAAEAGDEVAILGNIADYRPELEEMALAGNQLASLFLSRIYNRGVGIEASQSMTCAWMVGKGTLLGRRVRRLGGRSRRFYAFYRISVNPKARKAGEQLLKKRLAVPKRRTGARHSDRHGFQPAKEK